MREKLSWSIDSESESDNVMSVGIGDFYESKNPYESDFFQCCNCLCHLDIACVRGQIEEGMDDVLPFKC